VAQRRQQQLRRHRRAQERPRATRFRRAPPAGCRQHPSMYRLVPPCTAWGHATPSAARDAAAGGASCSRGCVAPTGA
jgi:hypothetical protein